MEDQVDQAISKNANGQEGNNSDTDVEAAEIRIEKQFEDINPVRLNLSFRYCLQTIRLRPNMWLNNLLMKIQRLL